VKHRSRDQKGSCADGNYGIYINLVRMFGRVLMRYLYVVLMILFTTACSDEQQQVEGNHVWKEQTEMIDKARDIESLINDAAQQKQQEIDDQTR